LSEEVVKMGKSKKNIVPDSNKITDFLRGQSSKIFKSVKDENKTVIVNKHSEPYVVVISYDKYKELKERNVGI